MKNRFPISAAARQADSDIFAGATSVLRFFAERLSLSALLLCSLSSPALGAHAPAGTVISNIAAGRYMDGTASGSFIDQPSNIVSVTTVSSNLPISIELMKYSPTALNPEMVPVAPTDYSPSGSLSGPFTPLPLPTPFGVATPIDLNAPVPLVVATEYHSGEPVFVRVTALDQNLDPDVRETIVTTLRDVRTGESRVLRLTETGSNTGIFVGYIQSASSSSPAALSVGDGSRINATFVDPTTGDSVTAAAVPMVDPYGRVFDSSTGELIDGVVVTLLNADTNLPAAVFGDDGDVNNTFPSTVTTGSTVQDRSGKVYSFIPGEYRFPFLLPGNYRLVTASSPKPGYKAPSRASLTSIRSLPNGSFFVLPANGPRGETFPVNAGDPAIRIDIPVDPLSKLYLTKTAAKPVVAVGDFLQYTLTVENTDTDESVLAITVSDTLPLGFRYRKGSAKLNGVTAPDPVQTSDGRTLSFIVGDLAKTAKATISYVVEVAAGAVKGKAVNTAVAAGTNMVSNTALETVLVRDDLFSSTAFIVGRVFVGCSKSEEIDEGGVAGVRLFMENGTYVVTDKNGKYHIEGVAPGSHVVQIDLDSLPQKYEVVACEENARFAGTPYSQFVDLQAGTLWRADFHVGLKPRAVGEVGLELRSVLTNSAGDGRKVIEYSVPVHVGHVPVRDLRLTIMLPDGAVYQPGTSALNAVSQPDPASTEGVLTYRLGDRPADWEGTLHCNATVPVSGKAGDLPTKAFLNFDTPETKNVRSAVADNLLVRRIEERTAPIPDIVVRPRFATLSAELTAQDRKMLDRLIEDLRPLNLTHVIVEGHTDSDKITGRGMEKFKDNYVLGLARATTVGRYLAAALGFSPEQMEYVGRGPDVPVATNKTEAGRAKNRRVEISVRTGKELGSADLRNEKDRSGVITVPIAGLRAGELWLAEKKDDQGEEKIPDYTQDWLDTAQPGLEWIWPGTGYHPSIPACNIAIKLDPTKKTVLLLNGEEVDGFFLDSTLKRADYKVALSMWRGVHLIDGDNLFEAVEYDDNNAETARVKRPLHYSGPPVKAELAPAQSKLAADGKNPPVIAVRLTDKDGHPAREGVLGEYSVDAPRVALQRVDELQKNPLTASATERLKYQVGPDGIIRIELQPTNMSGEAVLRFSLMNGAQEVKAWLTPEERDWILVGLAEGTVGYNAIKGNMESAVSSGEDNQLFQDDRLAFYAKGRIKGEWLMTIAYDSDKNGNRQQRNLFQSIDPKQYYTLYGDATNQGSDAQSVRSLYLKIERNKFYALFGDYDTGLNVTELSRYSRQMNGIKAEEKSETYDYTVFGSQSDQAFVKDEFQGDGTSGLYHLSRKNILLNSESVVIETRDRFRSEVIVKSQVLTRYIDYSFDYDAGTIWFKSPVFSRDENLNPNFIVVRYELFDTAGGSYNYGGRGAVRILENKVELGATGIHEEAGGGAGNLTGVDATVKLDEHTKIRAEVAKTTNDENVVASDGSAYLAEMSHRTDKMEGKAYVRQQEAGFGLGQQSTGETGMRKVGFDLTYRLNPEYSLGPEMYRQMNLTTGADRDVAVLQNKYATKYYELTSGVTYAEDSFVNSPTLISEQIFAGARYQLTDRLSISARRDQSLNENENNDFPTRTTLGADYKLNGTSTLYANEEFTQGAAGDTATSRIGVRAAPWTGGQVGSTVEQQSSENGERLFSTLGLKQSWQVTKQWSVDGGLDRSQTLRQSAPTVNPAVTPASGSTTDFTAVSFGAGYRATKWSWTVRGEERHSPDERKQGLFSGINGELREGLGLAVGVQSFHSTFTTGASSKTDDVRLGLAYRPHKSEWIVLDRLDFLIDEKKDSMSNYDSRRIVNNLNANYKATQVVQVALQYACKYVMESIDALDYRGYTDLAGLELRYDLTKRWDIGIRGRQLHSWAVDEYKYGTGASVGYNFVKNVLLRVGYNFTGFKDRDFSKSDFTSEGPYLKVSMKFDQMTVRDAVKWFSGQ